jgi:hypothetical protein
LASAATFGLGTRPRAFATVRHCARTLNYCHLYPPICPSSFAVVRPIWRQNWRHLYTMIPLLEADFEVSTRQSRLCPHVPGFPQTGTSDAEIVDACSPACAPLKSNLGQTSHRFTASHHTVCSWCVHVAYERCLRHWLRNMRARQGNPCGISASAMRISQHPWRHCAMPDLAWRRRCARHSRYGSDGKPKYVHQ